MITIKVQSCICALNNAECGINGRGNDSGLAVHQTESHKKAVTFPATANLFTVH